MFATANHGSTSRFVHADGSTNCRAWSLETRARTLRFLCENKRALSRILAFTTALFLVTTSAAGQNPLQVAPKNYKTFLENDRERVIAALLEPGDRTLNHFHGARVVYSLSGSAPLALHEEVLSRSGYFVDGESGARLFVRRVTAASNRHIPILLVHGGSPPSEVIFDLPVPGYSLAEDLARCKSSGTLTI